MRHPEQPESGGDPQAVAQWLLRMETGWGMPHDWVAFLASLVIVAHALPTAPGRIEAAWRRLRG